MMVTIESYGTKVHVTMAEHTPGRPLMSTHESTLLLKVYTLRDTKNVSENPYLRS